MVSWSATNKLVKEASQGAKLWKSLIAYESWPWINGEPLLTCQRTNVLSGEERASKARMKLHKPSSLTRASTHGQICKSKNYLMSVPHHIKPRKLHFAFTAIKFNSSDNHISSKHTCTCSTAKLISGTRHSYTHFRGHPSLSTFRWVYKHTLSQIPLPSKRVHINFLQMDNLPWKWIQFC